MRFHPGLLALGGAFVVQSALCQAPNPVSMSVTTGIGTVGQVCEPFQCLPHQTLAGLGERLRIDVFGVTGTPYVLFVGTPVTGCLPIAGFTGELAAWAPLVTLAVGSMTDAYDGNACGLSSATSKFSIPMALPIGMQLRLQAVAMGPLDGDAYGFTRAVEIHTR